MYASTYRPSDRLEITAQERERLSAMLRVQASQLAAAEYRWLRVLERFDRAGGWARALPCLPAVCAEFEAGRLSYSKVRAITRIATPETEGLLVTWATTATAAQLERIVRGVRRMQRIEEADADHETCRRRYLRWRYDEDGSVVSDARLAPTRFGGLGEVPELAAFSSGPAPGVRREGRHDGERPVRRSARRRTRHQAHPGRDPQGPARPARRLQVPVLRRDAVPARAPRPSLGGRGPDRARHPEMSMVAPPFAGPSPAVMAPRVLIRARRASGDQCEEFGPRRPGNGRQVSTIRRGQDLLSDVGSRHDFVRQGEAGQDFELRAGDVGVVGRGDR